MKKVINTLKNLAVIASFLLVLPMQIAINLHHTWQRPIDLGEETLIWIPRGVGLNYLSQEFVRQGFLDQSWQLTVGAKLFKNSPTVKFGEFALSGTKTIPEIIEELKISRPFTRSITLTEGTSVREFLLNLQENPYFDGRIDFSPLEGHLMPDTYFYHRGDDINSFLERLINAQTAYLDELWQNRPDNFYLTSKHDVLTMASIIEKESGVTAERNIIASVFKNRLERGMRLQSDPTVIYGITEGLPLNRAISRDDLNDQNPYNTYRIDGLPPTPITNPGREAIKAVFNPANTNFLYFVADGEGGHRFAPNLREHNRNVQRWRNLQQR